MFQSAQKEEINIGIGNVTHKRDESRNATPHREINLLDMLVGEYISIKIQITRDFLTVTLVTLLYSTSC